jgi:hypothetical protein
MPNMKTKKGAGNQQVSSPTFKKIVSDVDSGKITLNQAINKIVPPGTPQDVKKILARAMGTQTAVAFIAGSNNRANNKVSKKTQTRKPSK